MLLLTFLRHVVMLIIYDTLGISALVYHMPIAQ